MLKIAQYFQPIRAENQSINSFSSSISKKEYSPKSRCEKKKKDKPAMLDRVTCIPRSGNMISLSLYIYIPISHYHGNKRTNEQTNKRPWKIHTRGALHPWRVITQESRDADQRRVNCDTPFISRLLDAILLRTGTQLRFQLGFFLHSVNMTIAHLFHYNGNCSEP